MMPIYCFAGRAERRFETREAAGIVNRAEVSIRQDSWRKLRSMVLIPIPELVLY